MTNPMDWDGLLESQCVRSAKGRLRCVGPMPPMHSVSVRVRRKSAKLAKGKESPPSGCQLIVAKVKAPLRV